MAYEIARGGASSPWPNTDDVLEMRKMLLQADGYQKEHERRADHSPTLRE